MQTPVDLCHRLSQPSVAPLVGYETLGRDAALAAPTPEHYLPLLYVIGSRQEDDAVTFPVGGVDGRSVSMLSVQIG